MLDVKFGTIPPMPANNALLDGIKLKLDADLLKISAKLQMNKECVSLAIQDMTWSIMFVSFHHQILKDHLMLAAEPGPMESALNALLDGFSIPAMFAHQSMAYAELTKAQLVLLVMPAMI